MKKKSIFFTVAVLFIATSSFAQLIGTITSFGTFNDPRDGKIYKTVKIGQQLWMAENLAYKPASGHYSVYDNNPENAAKYGYQYDFETALKVCPAGWKTPGEDDWHTMAKKLDGKIKEIMLPTLGDGGKWWSSTKVLSHSDLAWIGIDIFDIYKYNTISFGGVMTENKEARYSVRCIKNSAGD